jgi:hypothetical protein
MPLKKKQNTIYKELSNLEALSTNIKLSTYEEEVTRICEYLDHKRSDKAFKLEQKQSFVEKLEKVLLEDTHSPDFIERIKFAQLFTSLNLMRERLDAVNNVQEMQDAFAQYHQLLSNKDLIRTYFDSAPSTKQERCLLEFILTHATSVNAIERCLGGLMNFEPDGNEVELEPLKKMLDSIMMVEELINGDHGKAIKSSVAASKMANLLPTVRQEFLDKYTSTELAAADEATQTANIKIAISKYFGSTKSGGSIDPVLMYSYLLRKQSYASQSYDNLGYHLALGIEKTQNSSFSSYNEINATLVDLYFEHELVDIFLENGCNISSEESRKECQELFRDYSAKRPIEADNAQCYIKGYSLSGDLEFLQLDSLAATIAKIGDPCRKLELYEYLFEALSSSKEYDKIVKLGASEDFITFCHSENNIGKNLLIHTIDAKARLTNNFTAEGYEEMSRLKTENLDSLAQIMMYACQTSTDPHFAFKNVRNFTDIAFETSDNEDLICAVFDSFTAKYPCFGIQNETGHYQITDETVAHSTIACYQNILAKAPQEHEIQAHYSKLLFKIYTFKGDKDNALELLPKIYKDPSEAASKVNSLIANWDEGIAGLGDIFDAQEVSFLEKYYLQSLTDRLISEEKLLSRQKRIDQIQDSRAHDSSRSVHTPERTLDLRACPSITDSQNIKYFIHCPEELLSELDRVTKNKFRNALNGKNRFARSQGETGIKHVRDSVVELKIRGNQRILGLAYHDICDQDGKKINIIELSKYCANSHSDGHSSSEFNHLMEKLSQKKGEQDKDAVYLNKTSSSITSVFNIKKLSSTHSKKSIIP